MSDPRPWHRLFGLSWIDFCDGSCLAVETERDLSLKQQFVDLVLTRQGDGPLPQPLPDGFDDLAMHNLVTFKSHQEALDGWSLRELVGHAVNLRKQVSPSMQTLLPESDFRLYAVCVRYPQNLARVIALRPVRAGVYEADVIDQRIRVIVVQELPLAEANAFFHLFSTRVHQVEYGKDHYQARSRDISTLFLDLLTTVTEDLSMSETFQEYARTRLKELAERPVIRELIRGLPSEIRLEGMTPQERLEGISPKERLEGISPKEWLEIISPKERLETIPPKERLEGLSPDQLRLVLEEVQRKLRNADDSNRSE